MVQKAEHIAERLHKGFAFLLVGNFRNREIEFAERGVQRQDGRDEMLCCCSIHWASFHGIAYVRFHITLIMMSGDIADVS